MLIYRERKGNFLEKGGNLQPSVMKKSKYERRILYYFAVGTNNTFILLQRVATTEMVSKTGQ
jgi:hypothetical protein